MVELKLGHREAAVAHVVSARKSRLEHVEQTLLSHPDLGPFLSNPEVAPVLFPKLPAGASRADQWRADLAFFKTRFLETHVPFGTPETQSAWEGELAELTKAVDALPDWQVALRLARVVRKAGAGHTWVLPTFAGPAPFHMAPLVVHRFADGWFVRSAAPAHQDLVGKQILRVGDLPVEEVAGRLAALAPHDNASGLKRSVALLMAMPEYLVAVGAQGSREELQLTLASVGGQPQQAKIPAARLSPQALQALGQTRHTPSGHVSAQKAGIQTPLWLRDPERAFGFERVPGHRAMYVQLNRMQDAPDESLAAFTARLFKALEDPAIDHLILDLRHNNGGNGELRWPLLHALGATPKFNRMGHLYVITGPQTFSAAANLVGDLDRQAYPIFVGEPAGAGPNFAGEDNGILLPNSGLMVMASSLQWQSAYSNDERREIAPDIEASLTSGDYREGRDPALAKILEDIRLR